MHEEVDCDKEHNVKARQSHKPLAFLTFYTVRVIEWSKEPDCGAKGCGFESAGYIYFRFEFFAWLLFFRALRRRYK